MVAETGGVRIVGNPPPVFCPSASGKCKQQKLDNLSEKCMKTAQHPRRASGIQKQGRRVIAWVVALGLGLATGATAQTIPPVPPLTDTGNDQCYSGSTAVGCDSVAKDTGTYPRQDGRYGRDPAAAAGQLTKVGGGDKGFDYTKVCNSGELAGSGNCLASAVLGTGPNDWACTKDNVTGLIWEVKTAGASDLRYTGHKYTWYSTVTTVNDGTPGSVGTNTCNATLPNSQCNTQAYVNAVNAGAGLCGATNWRLPTYLELVSLQHLGRTDTAIDVTYFPNSQGAVAGTYYWSASSYAASPANAWPVYFALGYYGAYVDNFAKSVATFVRVVRTAP